MSEKLRAHVKHLAKSMRCNCNLDKWEPERSTGHSFACRIHKATMAAQRGGTLMTTAADRPVPGPAIHGGDDVQTR